MFNLRRRIFCKSLAVLLSVFFLMEAHVLYAQQSAAQSGQLEALFETARAAYVARNYEEAKTVLDNLIGELETTSGQDKLKGEAYLLAGAVYERLDLLGPSVKYYCRAKDLLGAGVSIEGLNVRALKYYGADCAAIAAVLAEMEGPADDLTARFNQARIGYFAGAFEAAKTAAESLITSLGAIEGRDELKGRVFLLAGAIYEVLEFREHAIKYYCRAKAILGEGTTIAGLKLETLRWYKEPCGGAAVAGTAVRTAGRRRGGFGLFGFVLGLALVGGLVWYLFFSKNAPLGKKGTYKSITFHVEARYRGLNSKGHRRFTIGTQVKNDENFLYSQFITDPATPCSAAVKEENYSYSYTLTGDSVVMKQEWQNWDYYAVPAGGAAKKLCGDYVLTVDSYEYEGGRDPGKPSAEGLENLQQGTGDCVDVTNRISNCTMEANVVFKAPSSASAARGVSSVFVEMIRVF